MGEGDINERLKFAIALTLVFFIVEVIGGYVSGSLSILGDAGHMFRDVFSLITTFGAVEISRKLPTREKSFGYHRVEIFAAFINGILLLLISTWIFWESYQRYLNPQPIESTIMFGVALVGLLVNVYVASKLHGSHDLNVRSAFIHVLTDTISSVAIIFASIWIYFTGEVIVDPLLSTLIAALILFSAFPIIKESLWILLEFVPGDVDMYQVIGEIEKIEGVDGVHHVHIWALCSNINALNAHIFTNESDMTKIEKIKAEIKCKLEEYNIKHATLEFECEKCVEGEGYLCSMR